MKRLSVPKKIFVQHLYIFATQFRKPKIFHTKNSVALNNLSLKYQRFTPSGCKGKFEFVEKKSNPSQDLKHL